MKPHLIAALSAAVLAASTLASAGDADDTVLLGNGGRIRGTVMEQDPKSGVSIKLVDGTVRKLKASEVKAVEFGKATPRPVEAPAVDASPAPPAPPTAPPPPASVLAPASSPSSPTVQPLYDFRGGTHAPRSRRNSTGLFVTGLVLMPLGVLTIGGGAAFVVSTEGLKHDTDVGPGMAIFLAGGSLLLAGALFTVVGGARSRVARPGSGEDARAPRITPFVGPTSAGFHGTF